MRKQQGVLEHEAHPAAMRRHECADGPVLPDHAADREAAAIPRLQTGDDAQQRRLPASRRSEERNDALERDTQPAIEPEVRQGEIAVELQHLHAVSLLRAPGTGDWPSRPGAAP